MHKKIGVSKMKKNIVVSLLLAASLTALGGCNQNSSVSSASSLQNSSSSPVSSSSELTKADFPLNLSVISPKGSPAVSLAPFLSQHADLVSVAAPTDVIAAFTKAEKDVIIFDLTKGATFIQAKGAPYKLQGVLTNGNAFVVSTGKDADNKLEAGDKVVSFGTNSLFTKVFSTVFSIPSTDITEVKDVSLAYTVATTGLNNGEDVDYVILSEPFVSKAVAASSSVSVVYNLAKEFKDYSLAQGMNSGNGYDGFPQAGVFIKSTTDSDESKKADVESFLSSLSKSSQDIAENDGKQVLKFIKEDTEKGSYDAAATFGMDYASLSQVLDHTTNVLEATNALAFNYKPYDINGFFTDAKIAGFAPYQETTFSSYYQK